MGFSVNLTSSMSASVYALQQIQKLTDSSNNILATGKKVNSALDDPVAYFAAQDHTYTASDLSNRKDSMAEAIQTIKSANAGIESILDLIDSAKSLADSAQTSSSSTDSASLETQYNKILTQITDLVGDSGYKGTNLLGGTTQSLTVYFNQDGSSSLNLTGRDASLTGLGLNSITAGSWWDTANSTANKTNIQTALTALDNAKSSLRTMAKTLSMDNTIIQARQDFTSQMITTLNDGATNLTAADTNEESAKLLVLQTQQSLGLKSLSISSTAYKNVLSLFS